MPSESDTTTDRTGISLTIAAVVGGLLMIGAAGVMWGIGGTCFATGLALLIGAVEGEIIRAIRNR